MKRLLRTVLAALVLFCCTSSVWVKLTLIKPALVDVPTHIQTLVIIDRTLASDEEENSIEEILTGEILKQDDQTVQHTMEGFISSITNAPRFKVVRGTEKYIGDNTGKIFPEAMSWRVIQNLCRKYNADAVIAIETLDSDYFVTNSTKPVEKKDETGKIVVSNIFMVEGIATVDIGFRLYDPRAKEIVDQYQFSEKRRWDASGASITDAAESILNKVESVNLAGRNAGKIYGTRISPTYYTVKRYFYEKPKKNKKLAEGVRKSKVADWEGAIESWEEALIKSKKDKEKGRVAFNIAVAYEVLGDLEKAMEWAAKSYTEFEDKKADDYHRELKKRMRTDARAKRQMGE